MNVKHARSWLKNMKMVICVSLAALWAPKLRSDLTWYSHAWCWGVGLACLAFLFFIYKSRRLDRAILQGVAWEKKSLFNILLTTLLLYGFSLILLLTHLAFLKWSGVIPELNLNDDLSTTLFFAGIFTIMVRFVDCTERFFY